MAAVSRRSPSLSRLENDAQVLLGRNRPGCLACPVSVGAYQWPTSFEVGCSRLVLPPDSLALPVNDYVHMERAAAFILVWPWRSSPNFLEVDESSGAGSFYY
jgi:hypothetical protein